MTTITPDPRDPAAVQRSITSAYAGGNRDITIAPGTYPVGLGLLGTHLFLSGLRGLSLNCQGVTFVFADSRKPGLWLNACQGVAINGLTLRNATPPYTQGQITWISNDRLALDISLHAGYPQNFDDANYFTPIYTGYVFDRITRVWKNDATDFPIMARTRTGANTFRLTVAPTGLPATAVGDLVAFRGAGTGATLMLANCDSCRLESVSILGGAFVCFAEAFGRGNHQYDGCSIGYDTPAGAIEPPLLSSIADGLNSNSVGIGPSVTNCNFTGLADDGIAIHGFYGRVVDGQLTVQLPQINYLVPGDALRFYDAAGVFIGATNVVACSSGTTAKLTIADKLSIPAGAMFDSPSHNGAGFRLAGNRITNHRGRGIYVSASDGTIDNNTIEGSTIAGIVVGPDQITAQAGYSSRVRITNNTIRHVGYSTVGDDFPQVGGISVIQSRPFVGPAKPVPPQHTDIRIVGNTIEDVAGIQIAAEGVRGLTVDQNTFIDPKAGTRGSKAGWDDSKLIDVANCEGVEASGNTVQRTEPVEV